MPVVSRGNLSEFGHLFYGYGAGTSHFGISAGLGSGYGRGNCFGLVRNGSGGYSDPKDGRGYAFTQAKSI